MTTESDTRHEIARLESRAAWLTNELAKVEGQRDELQQTLLDHDGNESKH